jgi:3-hydroxybutyryl-CoA dehydratase
MNAYRWDELHEGLSGEFEAELTHSMMEDFLRLSGDDNPLHTSGEFAQRAGFPGVVAYGLLTSAFYSRLVGVYLPGKYCLLHGIDLEFVKPAFIGDRLRVSGRITYLNQAYRRAELRAVIHNRQGELISRAKIRVGLREP